MVTTPIATCICMLHVKKELHHSGQPSSGVIGALAGLGHRHHLVCIRPSASAVITIFTGYAMLLVVLVSCPGILSARITGMSKVRTCLSWSTSI